MNELFKDHPSWIKETEKIAKKCKIEIEMDQVLLPQFECPDQKTSEQYLEICLGRHRQAIPRTHTRINRSS